MATLGVNITGNERDLLRAFKSSERGARQFNRELGKAERGAIAGSGAFKGLGRSVAFASGTFLGVAGLTGALRASVDAAEEFGKASRSLNAQLRANRENVGEAAPAIELANAKLAKFGQTAADSEVALSRLDRATGNIQKAISLESLTANVAAARHISLAQAALLVGKVVQGTTTALNRGGLVIKKGTSVTEALKIATEKFAGQAAASVTPLEKLHASVTNLEIILGEGLLPTINKVADSLSKWLSQPVNQARVRKDVEETAHAFGTLAGAIGDVAGAFGKLAALEKKVPAHNKGLIELTRDAFNQSGVPRLLLGPFGHRRAKQGLRGPVGTSVPGGGTPAAEFVPPGTLGPQGSVTSTQRNPLTATQRNRFFDAAIGRRLDRVQDVRTLRGQVQALNEIAALIKQRLKKTKDVTRIATLEDDLVNVFRQRAGIRGQIAANAKAAATAADESILARLGFGVDRAGATANLNDDIAALNVLAAALRKQIKKGGDVLALQEQLFGVTQQIAGVHQQQQDDAAAAAAAAATKRQTAQFRTLGLGPGGAALVPGVETLKGLLGRVSGAVEGSFLDTKKTRSVLANIKKVLGEGTKAVSEEVRGTIRDMLADINRQLREHEKTTGPRFRKASANALFEGLGLSPTEKRALRGRLSRVGPGGTTPLTGSGAFGVITSSGGQPQMVGETTLVLDGWQLGRAQTKFTQTRQRRNPPQKRGPNAGQ